MIVLLDAITDGQESATTGLTACTTFRRSSRGGRGILIGLRLQKDDYKAAVDWGKREGVAATSTLALETKATVWYQWGMRKTSPHSRTGKSVHVRVPDRQLTLIKKWIGKQPEPKPSLPQAILRLAGLALASDAERSDE